MKRYVWQCKCWLTIKSSLWSFWFTKLGILWILISRLRQKHAFGGCRKLFQWKTFENCIIKYIENLIEKLATWIWK